MAEIMVVGEFMDKNISSAYFHLFLLLMLGSSFCLCGSAKDQRENAIFYPSSLYFAASLY
jgi:hypothetical protein